MNLKEYMREIKPGETVLIEHTSVSPYPVLLHAIGDVHGWERILVVDVIDSFLPVLRWLRLAGAEIPRLKRVKAGGTSNWGEIIFEVNPHNDPAIFLSRFVRGIRDYYKRNPGTITVVMNPERLIPLQDNSPRFILNLADLASTFLGNTSRKTFYFVNRELSEERYLALLEEAFTRVVAVDNDGTVRVRKSPNLDEENAELTRDMD
ncbi:hypothetical protein FH039_01115 [Thermococcus indicus]|uniref:Uncharacterized protein n=1 Tax=Thermococcus indicus TaxID=2586643 RepID=A0A4Y5SJW3_9EURY|nr:DUF257 family protein [Thermococcus indicus]QDA30492.1 hypothetical protein FH039_01115 [Thermococcus indicus]